MAVRMRDPRLLLVVVLVLSLGARALWLSEPCRVPCRSAADHVLVFDERYYVNAARVISGIALPPGAPYAAAPTGTDPNAEHPQLVKLILAGAIELFGDGPFAWRVGSLAFGTLALLGLYALARAAGASRRLAVVAVALMAADNLLLVHGRIATLDIYVLATMLWGVTIYLGGRPALAGVTIGIGACMKLVAPYALIAIALLEAFRHRWDPPSRSRRAASLAVCVASAAAVLVALLAVLGQIAPPYDGSAGKSIPGGPFAHLGHMLSYGASQVSPSGPRGIASYPWQWLVDLKPIVYLNINPARPAPGLYGIHPAAHFLGMISPPIMLVAIPAMLLAAAGFSRRLPSSLRKVAPAPSGVAVVGLAWFAATFVPFELLSAIFTRTSYLYYMVILMPGLYILAADAVDRISLRRTRATRRAAGAWAFAVLLAAILMYPFTPLP
jgi:predicted membrane-bound dolichyl-phosphate-mannose-protein mannosyltransferase